jgi:hypothetical protein
VKLCKGGSRNVQSLYLTVRIVVVNWRRMEEVMALSMSFVLRALTLFGSPRCLPGLARVWMGPT